MQDCYGKGTELTHHNQPPRPKPARITGVAHVLAATGYSLSGLRRLWRETAFRHIVLALAISAGVFAVVGAGMVEFAILAVMFLLLVAVEALNTAIECIVDHLAPHWAEFARDAKDLGSLATMCLVCANGVFILAVIARSMAAT